MPNKKLILFSISVIIIAFLAAIVFNFSQENKEAAVISLIKNRFNKFFYSSARPTPLVHGYILFPDFYRFEPVTFGLENIGSGKATLKNSAPWKIVKIMPNTSREVVVFTPTSVQVVSYLEPGKKKEWTWHQKDNFEKWVEPEMYKVIFDDFGASVAFKIDSTIGSSGFFTFGELSSGKDRSEDLRVFMTTPQSIRYAIEGYYQKGSKKHPIGKLVDDRPRKSPYDSKWSWHMDSDSIMMGEISAEVCQVGPSGVENHLDYWIHHVKIFCYVNSYVKNLY